MLGGVLALTAMLPRHGRDNTRAAQPRTSHSARGTDTTITTMQGVYTLSQATRGRNVFATYCVSCHTPSTHTGPAFRSKWYGRSLRELFVYIKREMPKNAPGSMSDDEYALALAYVLRLNGMPTGSAPLTSDPSALQRIRLDSVSIAP
jgi:mono/diheme cytochrome c family protein